MSSKAPSKALVARGANRTAKRPASTRARSRRKTTANTKVPEQLVFEAAHELVFKCGKATLILTSDGKITVKGESIVTDASGLNRVRGAVVKIN